MNIEDMIMNGASEEETNQALNQIKAEKARQEEALRAKKDKETLKQEARAYLINALAAYVEAFTDEILDEEDVAELEELLIKIEDMMPLYIKLAKMHEELDGDIFFKGMM